MNEQLRGNGRQRQGRPPYAPFKAFSEFVERAAREEVPGRVDSLLLNRWGIAAGNESALLTSLRALGLIDSHGQPTGEYREVRLSPQRRQSALRRCALQAYGDLPGAPDPRLDRDQLYDYFVGIRGLRGQLVGRAIRFYQRLAELIAESTTVGGSVASRHAELAPTAPAPTDLLRPARPAPILAIAIQIPPDASDLELTELFRRVLRCWQAAIEGAEPFRQ